MKKQYEPVGCEVQTLRIKNLMVKCKAGENATELLDKITDLIEHFSEKGDWVFKWDIE